jgi:hypothetical protein
MIIYGERRRERDMKKPGGGFWLLRDSDDAARMSGNMIMFVIRLDMRVADGRKKK